MRDSLVTGESPAQMASNAENVSIWWRHHVIWSYWLKGEQWAHRTNTLMGYKRSTQTTRMLKCVRRVLLRLVLIIAIVSFPVHVLFISYWYTLGTRQNGRHLSGDIFDCIFTDENVWIPVEISLKLPRVQLITAHQTDHDWQSLLRVMAWR